MLNKHLVNNIGASATYMQNRGRRLYNMSESKRMLAMRSKEWIIDAFFSLLVTENFNDITISEIAAKAELDRRTFYRHFKTKEDIVSYYFEKSSEEYEVALSKNKIYDNRAIANSFFTVCYRQREQLLILNRQNLSYLLLNNLNKIFIKYQNKYALSEELEHPYREYMLVYHIGGFWNLLIKWLSMECKESPDEMAEIIEQIMQYKQI